MADDSSPPAGPAPDFAGFYRATLAPLRRYLARLTGSAFDAQDLAHDAYARVFPVMHARDIAQPRSFLYTTARRLALNQLKRRHISPVSEEEEAPVDETPSGHPGVAQAVMARQDWDLLTVAFAALPPGCRMVLHLRKVELLSHEEISQRLGISISTVEKQHARALRLLRRALADGPAVQEGCEMETLTRISKP